MIPRELRGTVAALMLLSAGGLLMHLAWHPPLLPGIPHGEPDNLIPFLFGLAGLIAVPLLVCSKRTWLWGYLINGFGVILGSILMAHDSIAEWQAVPDASQLLLHSNLHLILLLMPKVIIGQRILLHYKPNGAGRMFTPGWWVRHFVYLTVVFTVGGLIGRI